MSEQGRNMSEQPKLPRRLEQVIEDSVNEASIQYVWMMERVQDQVDAESNNLAKAVILLTIFKKLAEDLMSEEAGWTLDGLIAELASSFKD